VRRYEHPIVVLFVIPSSLLTCPLLLRNSLVAPKRRIARFHSRIPWTDPKWRTPFGSPFGSSPRPRTRRVRLVEGCAILPKEPSGARKFQSLQGYALSMESAHKLICIFVIGAVMFNDSLTVEQCERLIQQLSETAFPFQCAHGRFVQLRIQFGDST